VIGESKAGLKRSKISSRTYLQVGLACMLSKPIVQAERAARVQACSSPSYRQGAGDTHATPGRMQHAMLYAGLLVRRRFDGASDFAKPAAVESVQVYSVGDRCLGPDELPLDAPVNERGFE
jgi:hypothetical protein